MADFVRGDCHKCKYETSAECVPRSQKMGFPHCYQSTVTNYDLVRVKSVEEMAEFFAQQEYRKPVFDGWLRFAIMLWGRECAMKTGATSAGSTGSSRRRHELFQRGR